jgi:hypothetical protein
MTTERQMAMMYTAQQEVIAALKQATSQPFRDPRPQDHRHDDALRPHPATSTDG